MSEEPQRVKSQVEEGRGIPMTSNSRHLTLYAYRF